MVIRPSAFLSLLLIALGLLLRTVQYLANRSLWLDEAMLALNLIGRSAFQLLQPLDYAQVAPAGFLLMERLAVILWGTSEYALRAMPLLIGLVSVPLFYGVARRILSPLLATIGLALFALSSNLIYYASELKQYGLDVLATLLLYALFLAQPPGSLSRSRLILGALIGGLAVWYSHPAVFVLAGIGVTMVVAALRHGERPALRQLLPVIGFWIASFVACYRFTMAAQMRQADLDAFWQHGFLPWPPRTLADALWLPRTFVGIFHDPGAFHVPWLPALLFLVGAAALWRRNPRQCSMLLSPLGFALLASAAQRYPFTNRLLLFAVPMLYLMVAEGTGVCWNAFPRWKRFVGPVLTATLLLPSVLVSMQLLYHPIYREELKPVLASVEKHWQPGDGMYIYHETEPNFRYYEARVGLQHRPRVMGIPLHGQPNVASAEMDRLKSFSRVWALFSDGNAWTAATDERVFLKAVERLGTRVHEFSAVGARAHLYAVRGSVVQVEPSQPR
ncbi:MAG: hypothetical protein HY597_04140 [Candidatus Omnitrophica bacterium]|nr:hypothetical protein [Candidatus Omnitrophota bacterium]